MNRNMRTGTILARCGLILSAAALAGVAGCSGHGKYTKEGVSLAKQRVAMAKAGTEYQMAQQQFFGGELDKALKTVDASLKITTEIPKVHVLKGRILLELGELTASYSCFQDAEKLDATKPEPHYYLGILHERFREPQIALERYNQAATMDDSNPQYVIAAAEMLMQMGRLDEAETLLNEKQDTFAYDAAIRQTQGHVHMLRGDYAAATQRFNQAILLAPDDPIIMEDLVQAQLAAGQYAEAEFNITRLMDASETERRDLKHMRARCLMSLDRPVEARSLLLELVESNEGASDVHAWLELGNVAYILQDGKRLDQASSRLIAVAPDRYEGYFLRAAYFRQKDELSSALKSADEAVRVAGSNGTGPLILRGMILTDMNRQDEAMQSFASAVELDPTNTRTRALYEALAQAGGKAIVGVETAPQQ